MTNRWRKPYSEHVIETPNGKPIYIQVRGDGRVIARCASVGPISANAVELIPEPDTPPRPPPPTDLTSDVVGRDRGVPPLVAAITEFGTRPE